MVFVNFMGNPCDGEDESKAENQRADANCIIVCVEEENYKEEPGDIRNLHLPQGQQNFVRSLRNKSDAKVIFVYFGGRPRIFGDMVDNSDAILLAFLPVQMQEKQLWNCYPRIKV